MRALFIVLIFVNLLSASSSYCENKCEVKTDPDTREKSTSLTCHLPAMLTFDITASDVLKSDGTLKRYWLDRSTVCDVLGWMNGAIIARYKVIYSKQGLYE
jgi:hypothetical protein